jgi:hypothetical protein
MQRRGIPVPIIIIESVGGERDPEGGCRGPRLEARFAQLDGSEGPMFARGENETESEFRERIMRLRRSTPRPPGMYVSLVHFHAADPTDLPVQPRSPVS